MIKIEWHEDVKNDLLSRLLGEMDYYKSKCVLLVIYSNSYTPVTVT